MFVACMILSPLVPLLAAGTWLYPAYFREYWGVFDGLPWPDQGLSPSQLAVGMTVSLVPAGLTAFALWRLAIIFREFAEDRAFSEDAVRAFRAFAAITFILALAKPFIEALLGIILTWNNGPGERILALTFRAEELREVQFGALLLALALVFRHAHRLADEQAHIL